MTKRYNGRVKMLNEKQLKELTTPRLMSYLESLQKVHDRPHWEEDNARFRAIKRDYSGTVHMELYKNMREWNDQHALVKKLLSTREHIK